MPRNPSDYVLDSKLKTEFLVGRVRHTRYIQGNSSRRRRIQIKETWDTEAQLGRGSYGIVRLERRRPTSTPDSDLDLPSRVRAVKEIPKTAIGGVSWDYMKELEIIAKFSHPRYAPYFVRTYGWFENAESVFITMEYFPLGDLQGFMRRLPPYSEVETRQIVRQLLEGVQFMHESGFAHRDIKPGNILVESNSPEWLVKITDFGISKRALDGETDFRTNVGTSGYVAPEVIGCFSEDNQNISYSVAVDIWAIGIIAFQLLLKRLPFLSHYDIICYFDGKKHLGIDNTPNANLSNTCQDFIKGLLSPNPVNRPTAESAMEHSWIAGDPPSMDVEESLFIEESPQELSLAFRDAPTPASVASLPWSNLHLTDSAPATEAPDIPLSTYRGPQFDASLLIDNFRNFSLETTKYFVLRSDNELDIETSIAHGTWTSSPRVNKILDKGFARANRRVVCFFSVIKSRKFCGVAQMTSPIDWVNTDEHWVEDSWKGRFDLNWLCLTEISFDKVKHIPVSQRTPGFRAVACYDGTEISAESAFELLRVFSSDERETTLRRIAQQEIRTAREEVIPDSDDDSF